MIRQNRLNQILLLSIIVLFLLFQALPSKDTPAVSTEALLCEEMSQTTESSIPIEEPQIDSVLAPYLVGDASESQTTRTPAVDDTTVDTVAANTESSQDEPASESDTKIITTRDPDLKQVVVPANKELRGIWYSYFDWYSMDGKENGDNFRKQAVAIMDNIVDLGLNTIFLHVHSHSDAFYTKSSYFPPTKYVTGKMGEAPDYDPLEIMIEEAHKRGIELHAWINPYRATLTFSSPDEAYKGISWEEIPESSIVKQWWNSPEHHRYVLFHNDNYYLNPAKEEVANYLTAAIAELVKNYDVDGVHFDDYFYPSLDDSSEETWFDKPEYEASGSDKTITQWRRDNVSRLVKKVYSAIKKIDSDIRFGISPAGNLDNLRSDNMYFVDIDRWMSKAGYIDYILPQLYWGFECRDPDTGKLRPWAYGKLLARWEKLKRHKNLKLYTGLALSRTGCDVADGNSTSEWLSHTDIIRRMIEKEREGGQCGGFSLFDYSDLSREGAAEELQNVRDLLIDS